MRRHLLRSKSFWLGLFACAGIVWKWVDSERWISQIWFLSRNYMALASGNEGFKVVIGISHPIWSPGVHWSRGTIVETSGSAVIHHDFLPDFLWSHTLILSVAIWTTWLVWRYRRMQRLIAERDLTKLTNAPPESNSPNP